MSIPDFLNSTLGNTDFGVPDMADVNDQASRQEMMANREALKKIQRASLNKRLPQDPGFCDRCGDDTASPQHLFCSLQCSKEDEALQNQRNRFG